jgi:AraC-like DNA-binding protein
MSDVVRFRSVDLSPAMFGRMGTWPEMSLAPAGMVHRLTPLAPAVAKLRSEYPGGRAQGYLCRLGHGIVASVGCSDSEAHILNSVDGNDMLSFNLVISGQLIIGSNQAGHGPMPVNAGQVVTGITDSRRIYFAQMFAGVSVRTVRVVCDPDRLAEEFHIAGGSAAIRQCFGGLRVSAISARSQRVAQELLEIDFDRPLALLRFEAKTLELMCELLEPLLPASGASSRPVVKLKEHRQVQDARALLELRYDNPPTIAELASKIGVNQSKLMREFKAEVGCTIAEYALRQRMEKARELLTKEGLGIAQVAYRVGYQHHSSFTSAFSDYFGCTPTALLANETSDAA